MRILGIAIVTAALLGTPFGVTAHEGHADAPGAETAGGTASGAVFVSETARRNLALGLAEAEVRPIEKTLTLIGEIAPVPSRSGAVSSRIAGRVASVAVAEGDSVRKGQPVVEVESLQVGDPPPRVRYAAPIDGIVIDRHVVPGDAVEPNLHLLEIADLSEVLAVGRVFEGQVGRVAVGQAVRVAVPSFPDRSFEGVVERLGGQLDPQTCSLPIYVRVESPDRVLRPNMRAVLSVVTERADAALAVPRGGVLGDFGAYFVFVERDGDPTLFERRPVVTGLSDDRWVEILDGVLPGERVVTAGNYSLQFLPPAPPEVHAERGGASHPEGDPTTPRQGWGVAPWVAFVAAIGAAAVSLAFFLGARVGRRRA